MARLAGETLVAPEIVYLEVLSMVKKAVRRKTLSSTRALEAVVDLVTLAIDTVPHRELVSRVWELRDNLTPYDAAYVALAEARDVPLLTADARLANATGPRCEIELIS